MPECFCYTSTMHSPADKVSSLSQVHEKWMRDCICELRQSATQAVPGHGNPYADIVFIGEAPGKAEDIQGIPFVGRAGKFLDEMLGIIKLKRDDVYMTRGLIGQASEVLTGQWGVLFRGLSHYSPLEIFLITPRIFLKSSIKVSRMPPLYRAAAG